VSWPWARASHKSPTWDALESRPRAATELQLAPRKWIGAPPGPPALSVGSDSVKVSQNRSAWSGHVSQSGEQAPEITEQLVRSGAVGSRARWAMPTGRPGPADEPGAQEAHRALHCTQPSPRTRSESTRPGMELFPAADGPASGALLGGLFRPRSESQLDHLLDSQVPTESKPNDQSSVLPSQRLRLPVGSGSPGVPAPSRFSPLTRPPIFQLIASLPIFSLLSPSSGLH
jgi:hypothetical protein